MKPNLLFLVVLLFFTGKLYAQRICSDTPPMSAEDAENNPELLRALGNLSVKWQTGQKIKVKFIDYCSGSLKQKIIRNAEQWERYANIDFVFVENGNADIRIAFKKNSGSWSYLGNQAKNIPRNQQTMNFGWLDDNSDDVTIRDVVLHEFGHALGLEHEHKRANVPWEWNIPAVLSYYRDIGWSDERIYDQVINRYTNTANMTNNRYDRYSIMHYPISENLTKNGYSVPWNTRLSEMDKITIAQMYPTNGDNEETETEEEENHTYAVVQVGNLPSLNLRSEPSKRSVLLKRIPNRAKVELLRRSAATETVEGLRDYWYLVKYNRIMGWVFGGYLNTP